MIKLLQTSLKTSLIIGITFAIQSTLSISSQAEGVQTETSKQTSNQMKQLLKSWGLELTKCQGNVVQITHDVTGEKGCVVPNKKLPAGNFIYNSAAHTISSMTTQQASHSPDVAVTVGQSETPQKPETKPKPELAESKAQDRKIKEFVFDFNNTYDYAACLDVILLAYERRNAELENVYQNDCATNVLNTFGKNLSKDVALQLVELANLHATKELEDPLYPSFGLRRRIAINLGYVYDMDKNNPDILKYINPESK